MRLSKIGEFGLIQSLRRRCRSGSPGLLTGIGDDAAVIGFTKQNALFTTDMLLEGVHFDLSTTTFDQLGHKFLAVNISDIFAMGGKPGFFLISIGIPETFKKSNIEDLYSGVLKTAKKFGVSVIGGDTCASKQGLILSGTLIGTAKRTITRSGAKVGDRIFVTDMLGDSAMGLMLLKKRGKRVFKFRSTDSGLRLMKRHLMPEPAPLKNPGGTTSMIDISDGLLIDLSHICDESRVGAMIYKDLIPLSQQLVESARKQGKDPLAFALKGGEDYVLLFTAPPGFRTTATKIGEIIKKGRYLVDGNGKKTLFEPEGYEHFR